MAALFALIIIATLYFADRYGRSIGIVAFLLWGYFARPQAQHTWACNLLIVQTCLALLIHIGFPLSLPRMCPEWGLVDTLAVFGPNAYEGASAPVANQYTALPSLRVAWAVLIAVVLCRTAQHRGSWRPSAYTML